MPIGAYASHVFFEYQADCLSSPTAKLSQEDHTVDIGLLYHPVDETLRLCMSHRIRVILVVADGFVIRWTRVKTRFPVVSLRLTRV